MKVLFVLDFLKKKAELLFVVCVVILADVIPVICIMAGIWIVRYSSKFFGFDELTPVKLLITFEEMFMMLFYLAFVVFSMAIIYRLFKEGKL